MNILAYILLLASGLTGGSLAFILEGRYRANTLLLLLSFSGAFLLGVTVLHLIPHVYEFHDELVSVWVMAGFFIQFVLVQFSKGVEHGHIHHSHHISTKYVLGVLFGLSMHSFLEGIPLADGLAPEESVHPLLIGIILHKIPASFALMSILLASPLKKTTLYLTLLVFSLMTPLSAFIFSILPKNGFLMDVSIQHYLTALVIGSFLHISTTILFESSSGQHRVSLYKFIAIVLGFAVSLFSMH